MWIDLKNWEEDPIIEDCDSCVHGEARGPYTEVNNWCNLHNRNCEPFNYKCEKYKGDDSNV